MESEAIRQEYTAMASILSREIIDGQVAALRVKPGLREEGGLSQRRLIAIPTAP
jgi:hypothetical protein